MEEITINIQPDNKGFINLMVDKSKIGFMEIEIAGDILTVSHTEVMPAGQGKGYAGKLLAALVDYARTQHFKIRPVCSYVGAQFKRHPDEYADVRLKI